MSSDLLSTVIGMMAGRTQQLTQIAVMRKSHQMDQAMLQMIEDVTRSAPAPTGQGGNVDKRA